MSVPGAVALIRERKFFEVRSVDVLLLRLGTVSLGRAWWGASDRVR